MNDDITIWAPATCRSKNQLVFGQNKRLHRESNVVWQDTSELTGYWGSTAGEISFFIKNILIYFPLLISHKSQLNIDLWQANGSWLYILIYIWIYSDQMIILFFSYPSVNGAHNNNKLHLCIGFDFCVFKYIVTKGELSR